MLARHVSQGAGQLTGGACSLKEVSVLQLEFRAFLVSPWEGGEAIPLVLGMGKPE